MHQISRFLLPSLKNKTILVFWSPVYLFLTAPVCFPLRKKPLNLMFIIPEHLATLSKIIKLFFKF